MLRKLLAVSLLCAASAASAALEASNGPETVVVYSTPCENEKVLENIPKEMQKDFFSAEYFSGKTKINGCWTDLGDVYGIIYEDGDQGMVPKSDFKEKGV